MMQMTTKVQFMIIYIHWSIDDFASITPAAHRLHIKNFSHRLISCDMLRIKQFYSSRGTPSTIHLAF